MNTAMLTELTSELNFLTPAPAAERTNSIPKEAVAVPAKSTTRTRRAARRRTRMNWDTVGVVLLMLTCTVIGLYRLIWMGQL